jgi:hypothetical protein
VWQNSPGTFRGRILASRERERGVSLPQDFQEYSDQSWAKLLDILWHVIIRRSALRMASESYQEYQARMETMEMEGKIRRKNAWIIETFNGTRAGEEVFTQNEEHFLIASGSWRSDSPLNELHMLAFPPDFRQDNRLKTVRDLTGDDLGMLQDMKQRSLQFIQERFHLEEEDLDIYFHYWPSTYILHCILSIEGLSRSVKEPNSVLIL